MKKKLILFIFLLVILNMFTLYANEIIYFKNFPRTLLEENLLFNIQADIMCPKEIIQ